MSRFLLAADEVVVLRCISVGARWVMSRLLLAADEVDVVRRISVGAGWLVGFCPIVSANEQAFAFSLFMVVSRLSEVMVE